MPTVERFAHCGIEMYFGNHPPPHFHIIARRDKAALHLIDTLGVWAGSANSRNTREALEWSVRKMPEPLVRWQQHCEVEDQ